MEEIDFSFLSEEELYKLQNNFIKKVNDKIIYQIKKQTKFTFEDISFLENFYDYIQYIIKNNDFDNKEQFIKFNNLVEILNEESVSDWLKDIYKNTMFLYENNLINNLENKQNKMIL